MAEGRRAGGGARRVTPSTLPQTDGAARGRPPTESAPHATKVLQSQAELVSEPTTTLQNE